MNMLMGIGNPDRGDDGAGNRVAAIGEAPDWLVFDCGTAPENFTGLVRKHKPRLLVLVDAADMALPPGEFRIVSRGRIRDAGIGTHAMSLADLMDYLDDCAEEILFIGIQPKSSNFGEDMSDEVSRAAHAVAELIRQNRIAEIERLD